MVFNPAKRALLMGMVAIVTGVLPPLIHWFRLTPVAVYRDSLGGDSPRYTSPVLLYLVAYECPPEDPTTSGGSSSCVDRDAVFQEPRLLAKSFQAARLLGTKGKVRANHLGGSVTTNEVRANHVGGSVTTNGVTKTGTFIGVYTAQEGQQTLELIQKSTSVSLELIPIAVDDEKPVIASFGYLEGDLAQWLLPYKLKWAADKVASQRGVRLLPEKERSLQVRFHNVVPLRRPQPVDWATIYFVDPPAAVRTDPDDGGNENAETRSD